MTPVWLFVCKWDVQTALGNSFALQQILEISFHRNGNNSLIVSIRWTVCFRYCDMWPVGP